MNDGSTILVAPFIGQGVALQSPTSAPGSNGQVPSFDTDSTFAAWVTPLANIVEDTTPQLGASLDVNGQKIVSVSNGDIDIEPNGTGNVLLGNLTFDADQSIGAGQDNYVLTYDNGTGLISLEAAAAGSPGGADTQVQFNNAGAFGGTSNFTINTSNHSVSITNSDTTVAALTVNTAGQGLNKPVVDFKDNGTSALTVFRPTITQDRGVVEIAMTGGAGLSGTSSGFALLVTSASGTIPFGFRQNALGSSTPALARFYTADSASAYFAQLAASTSQFILNAGTGIGIAIKANGFPASPNRYGDITIGTAGQLGFFQGAPVAKPTVTGSRGGNAALASLLTSLANLGLITDSSSA